jgi:hypothetical protein
MAISTKIYLTFPADTVELGSATGGVVGICGGGGGGGFAIVCVSFKRDGAVGELAGFLNPTPPRPPRHVSPCFAGRTARHVTSLEHARPPPATPQPWVFPGFCHNCSAITALCTTAINSHYR